jgi:hypothetical protein
LQLLSNSLAAFLSKQAWAILLLGLTEPCLWFGISFILSNSKSHDLSAVSAVQRQGVWYQLLLASLDDSACRDELLQQEAAVLAQLQQAGQDSTTVELALDEARMRAELSSLQRRFRKQLKKEREETYGMNMQ